MLTPDCKEKWLGEVFIRGRRRFAVHVEMDNVEEAAGLAAEMGFKSGECSRTDDLDARAPLCQVGNFDDGGGHKAMWDVSVHLRASDDDENVGYLALGAARLVQTVKARFF
jgi:hypothetical protein